MGGNQLLSIEKFGGQKTNEKERIRKLALGNTVKEEGHLRDVWGVTRRDRNENVFSRPNGLRENAETTILSRRRCPARTKKEVLQVYIT